MKIRNILCTIILILVLSITVGFSAFVSEMSICKLVAEIRVEKDIRITDVVVTDGIYDNGNFNINYDTDSILLDYFFDEIDDYVMMDVTITNFGGAEVGIFDINLPEGISYEMTNYSLKDKLCDNAGICSLGISKVINFKFYPTSEAGLNLERINIDFDFKEFYSVQYQYIANSNIYPNEVLDSDTLNVVFNKPPVDLDIYLDGSLVDSSEYTYSNGVLTYPSVDGEVLIVAAKTLNYIMQLGANSDSGVNFGSNTGLETLNNTAYVRSGTENNNYPIYYYRGTVSTNNVLFGDYCWKIVRTTDTGGVKLIYNGVPSSSGSCNNTDVNSQLSNLKPFNSVTDSPAYVGYMYGTVYNYGAKSASELTDNIIYSNSFEYSNGNYVLAGDIQTSSDWANDRTILAKKYHYSCLTSSDTCETIKYISYFGDSNNAYYLTLSDGKDIEVAKSEMFSNLTSSTIKTEVDNWYAENLDYYTSLFEDTIYCNDRSLVSGSLMGKDVNAGTGYSMFGAVSRVYSSTYNPSLTCPSVNDSFTVDSTKGNGALTYPVGLLTADEMTLVGNSRNASSTTTFLYSGQRSYSMSPYCFSYHSAYHLNLVLALGFTHSGTSMGVRPVISLKENSVIVDGDGTVDNPFIIKSIFDINGVYYYYEPGMTWNEWINSKYNTSGVNYIGEQICENNGMVDASIDEKIESMSYTKTRKCTPIIE